MTTTNPERETAVALGSNMGDPLSHIRAALAFLDSLKCGRTKSTLEVSPLYRTRPVDCPPGSPDFINAVAIFPCSHSPETLLGLFKMFESERGRQADAPRNSPRPLDLDLLYCGEITLSTPALTLPHPRMAERLFVLKPLAHLRPDLILSKQSVTILNLLNQLLAREQDTTIKIVS